MALEPALIRSSTSLTQLSASPTFGSLSFAGSLAGSMTYERKQQRLPPVDPEKMHTISQRKLRANAAVLHRAVERQLQGEAFAKAEAARLEAESLAVQSELKKHQAGLDV